MNTATTQQDKETTARVIRNSLRLHSFNPASVTDLEIDQCWVEEAKSHAIVAETYRIIEKGPSSRATSIFNQVANMVRGN